MEKQSAQAVTEVPWELPNGYKTTSVLPASGDDTRTPNRHRKPFVPFLQSLAITLGPRLDRLLPPQRKYTPAKLRRRTFLLALLGVLIAVLVVVIGLSVGLTRRSQSQASLPLPTGANVYTGDLTYYEPGLGACGITSGDNDDIVAISHSLFDSESQGSNPNANPFCGRMLRAQRFDSRVGKTVSLDLKVVDRCVGCQPTDLDVSPGAFSQLADPNLGRVHDMSWAWI